MAKYLSYNDLDAIAARVFRAYSKLPEVQAAGQVLYVDPNLLLKSLLGLTIEYRHLSQDRTTLGITAYDEVGVEICGEDEDLFFFDGKTVLIESDLQAEDQTGRRNFTIVHEGCHHVLKMLFPKDYWYNLIAVKSTRDNDTPVQPQLHAMGTARRDTRRGKTACDASTGCGLGCSRYSQGRERQI